MEKAFSRLVIKNFKKEDHFLYQHLFCKLCKPNSPSKLSLEVPQIAPEMASIALYYINSNFNEMMHYKLGRR